jgi:hypothetical protein
MVEIALGRVISGTQANVDDEPKTGSTGIRP